MILVSFKLSLFKLGDSSKITRYDYAPIKVFRNRDHFPHNTVSVIQTCTYILRAGASILPPRVLASGIKPCGNNKYAPPSCTINKRRWPEGMGALGRLSE